MRKPRYVGMLLGVLSLIALDAGWAEDRFLRIPIAQLEFTDGKPGDQAGVWGNWRMMQQVRPYAVVGGAGEAYLTLPEPSNAGQDRFGELVVKASQPGPVTGTIYLRGGEKSPLAPFKFTAPEAKPEAEAEKTFYATKASFYRDLWDRSLPGGAWFQLQASAAQKASGETNEPAATNWRQARRNGEPGDEYELFTGGRALSENLQLDRPMAVAGDAAKQVEIGSLKGVEVAAIDWAPLVAGLKPEIDVLANYIPEDQHAVLFPSFQSLLEVLDRIDRFGSLLGGLSEERGEEVQMSDRYQQQLCLPTSELARQLGPLVVNSVAMTGGDLYLKTGSDLTVLFECGQPAILLTYVKAKHVAIQQKQPDCAVVSAEWEGLRYSGLVNAQRTISSYVCTSGKIVCVSNSKQGIEAFAKTVAGQTPALAKANEYIFFRNRYPKANESAFIVLTDATIRRWCSPRWRIGCARRTTAAAAMYRRAAEEMQKGSLPALENQAPYGNLEFLTPISELEITEVSDGEATAYRTWKNQYQSYWRGMFDPIAVQLGLTNQQLSVDMSVIPLIAGTDYRQWIERTRGSAIGENAGYRHKEAIVQVAAALNVKSKEVSFLGEMFRGNNPGLADNPLGWMGSTVSLFLDQDPIWDELGKKPNLTDGIDKEIPRLPVGLAVEVVNPLGAAAFLTALRAMANDTAPNMMVWESQEYQGMKYMKIRSSDANAGPGPMGSIQIFYLTTPKRLIVTINEAIIKRAIDRKDQADEASPWLGKSVCLQVSDVGVRVVQALLREELALQLQRESWNNLPILNEWHRQFPNEDPVEVHYRYSRTRLVCPAGGKYVWNPTWATMESTATGSPGNQKKPSVARWEQIQDGNFGLTLENNQLRAKVVLTETKR